MRFAVDLTEDDYLAFARHAADHQAMYVAARRSCRWTLVVMAVLIGLFAVVVVLVVTLIQGLGFGSYPGRRGGWPGVIERYVKKAMKAGHLSPDLGRVEIALTPEGLGMTSQRGTVREFVEEVERYTKSVRK